MKKTMKMLCMAAAIASAAFTAQAADINNTIALTLTNGSTNFGDVFGLGTTGKTFKDLFTFTVGSASDLDAVLTSISTKTVSDLNITGFNLISGSSVVVPGVQDSTGHVDLWEIGTASLAPGSYALEVDGSVLGSKGGSFGGNVNVSPVPEPSTWGMMAVGLGLLGFTARRKKAD